MLETIREFAAERLDASGERERARRRHAEFFLEMVERLESGLKAAEETHWLRRFERDLENIRAAFGWAEEHGDAEVGVRLAAATWRFWVTKAYYREGRERLDAVLALPEWKPSEPRACSVFGRGRISLIEGDVEAAEGWFRSCLEISREVHDLNHMAGAFTQLGHVARERGNLEMARTNYQESLAIRRALGDPRGLAISLSSLGHLLVTRGELDAAEAHFEEALASAGRVGFQNGIALALQGRGRAALARGDLDTARARTLESLAIWRQFGDTEFIVNTLDTLAVVELAAGRGERATRLLAAVEAGRARFGIRRRPAVAMDHDTQRARAREVLGEGEFAEAWAAGQAMSIEEAAASALDEPSPI
jgi:tetratricopeptide (TPR) repeat protein